MSSQGRESEPSVEPLTPGAEITTAPSGGSTNLLQRWVRLVQSAGLYGNEAGQVRLDELASGPTTPRISTLEEVRAARARAVAEEDAADEGAGGPWWDDGVDADAVCEEPPVEEPEVCELDDSEDTAELEPAFGELPPMLPPEVLPPVLPAAGEELLSRILSFGARWLGPVVLGMYPKPTAPPELDRGPASLLEGGPTPVSEPRPRDDNKCRAEKVDHLGGDDVHNTCADSIPGNAAAGGDWLVRAPVSGPKNFDAWTPADNTVWEVKTLRFSDYDSFVKGVELLDEQRAAVKDNKVAQECGYNYAWQVSDLEHFLAIEPTLTRLGIPVTYQPECLRVQDGEGTP